jgi:hypothetical protein
MSFLDGYKSYIGAGLGVLIAVLSALGFLTPEMTGMGLTIATAVFGAGFAGKIQKVADSLGAALAKDDPPAS